MNDPERDQLWDLLGKAKSVAPSHFFSAKVIAAVREVRGRHRAFWTNWVRFGLPGALAGALTVFLTVFTVRTNPTVEPQPMVTIQPEPIDLELIANLDFALSSEESSVWLDSSAH